MERGAVDEPTPTENDKAVRRALLVGLRHIPNSAYRIENTWIEDAGWFFTVEPNNPRAASISVGAEDGSVNLTVGNSSFEKYAIEDLPTIVEQAFGHNEEIGPTEHSRARVDAAGHPFRFGHVQLPLPWKWRRKRRIAPYSESIDGPDQQIW